MKTYNANNYSGGRLIHYSERDTKQRHEKVTIRIAGGVRSGLNGQGRPTFFAITRFRLFINGDLIIEQPKRELRNLTVVDAHEATWIALADALSEFVDRATQNWSGEWVDNGGNLGWNLEVQSGSEAFLEEVEEELAGLDGADFELRSSSDNRSMDGAVNLLRLFSNITLRLVE